MDYNATFIIQANQRLHQRQRVVCSINFSPLLLAMCLEIWMHILTLFCTYQPKRLFANTLCAFYRLNIP